MGCFITIVAIFLILIGIGSLSSTDVPASATNPPTNSSLSKPEAVVLTTTTKAYFETSSDTVPLQLNWDLQVENWQKLGKKLCWSNYNNCQNAKGIWYSVKINVENSSNTKASLSSMNFRLHDSKNRKYNHYENLVITKLYADYINEQEIDNVIIYPDQRKKFILLFDIPESADNLLLEFMPNFREKSTELSLNENNQLINNKINQKEWELDVLDIENKGKELEWSNYGDMTIASGKWLIVKVNVKNLANQNIALNPINFRILDTSGRTYEHYQNLAIAENYGVYRSGQAILNNIVETNKQSTYYLVYDIPLEAEVKYLEFIPKVKQQGKLFDLKPENFIENADSPDTNKSLSLVK